MEALTLTQALQQALRSATWHCATWATQDAEDVAQDAIIRLWMEVEPEDWTVRSVGRLVKFCLIDACRKAGSRGAVDFTRVSMDAAIAVPSPVDDPETWTVWADLYRTVLNVLQQHGTGRQIEVGERWLQGQTAAETAAELQIRQPTVRVHRMAIRRLLRAAMPELASL